MQLMNAPRSLPAILFSLIALFSVSVAYTDESEDQAIIDETVALARSYVGKPADLNKVKSLSFSGVLVAGTGASGTTEVIYKEPSRSQMKTVIGGMQEVSTLNRTEAWRRVARVDRPGSWSLEFYPISDIYRMQAIVDGVLGFYEKPNVRGGRITYEGAETVDGREARVLVYHYGNGIWYKRFIDAQTGRLLKTENDIGMVVKETGEMVVDGLRFPAQVVTESQTPGGPARMQVNYSKIEVNPKVEDARFRVPLMTGQQP